MTTDTPNPEKPDPDLTEDDLAHITGGAQEGEVGRFAQRETGAEEPEGGRYEPRDLGNDPE